MCTYSSCEAQDYGQCFMIALKPYFLDSSTLYSTIHQHHPQPPHLQGNLKIYCSYFTYRRQDNVTRTGLFIERVLIHSKIQVLSKSGLRHISSSMNRDIDGYPQAIIPTNPLSKDITDSFLQFSFIYSTQLNPNSKEKPLLLYSRNVRGST